MDIRGSLGRINGDFAKGRKPFVRGRNGCPRVEHRADDEFRPGVAAADACHQRGALCRGEDVGHGTREPRVRCRAMKKRCWMGSNRRGAEVAERTGS